MNHIFTIFFLIYNEFFYKGKYILLLPTRAHSLSLQRPKTLTTKFSTSFLTRNCVDEVEVHVEVEEKEEIIYLGLGF